MNLVSIDGRFYGDRFPGVEEPCLRLGLCLDVACFVLNLDYEESRLHL